MNLKNDYRIVPGGVAEIQLTKGKVCYIDESDLIIVEPYRWWSNRVGYNWYAVTEVWLDSKRRIKIYMHALISGGFAKGKSDTDHVNNNTLDNRRCNLRLATRSQNLANSGMLRNNTTGYKGVTLHHTGKYEAKIWKDNRCYRLGLFVSPEDAAKAYNEAAIRLFAEFAQPNKIPGGDH